MNNPIMCLCEAIEKSELTDKKKYRTEILGLVFDLGEYFNNVVGQQMYFYTTPVDERDDNIMKHDDEWRRYCHDRCIYSCERLNEICSQLGIENICDFDTSDRRKVAEFCGYAYICLYCSNIICSEPMTEWLDKCPLNSSESRIVLPQSSEDQQTLDLIESISKSFYNNEMPYIFYSLIKKCLSEYSFEPEAIFEMFAEGCKQQIHRKPLDMEKLIEAWREKPTDNELKTVSDTEVLDAATKLMDRFDEAFKELAK